MIPVNFRAGRTYYQSSRRGTGDGWYFQARQARTIGPFQSREDMLSALQSFVKACVAAGDCGGRTRPRESAA
jgi:hypothetical protein